MKSKSICAIVLLLSVVASAHADWHVWTVTETRHVLRSDPPGHDRTVGVSAAQNEWVSFQVLMRCDEPVKAVRLEVGELRGPGGTTLPTPESRYYRQHQLHLETGTYRNSAFKPDWYPDPLIPFRHPLTGDTLGSARLAAVPFDLPANETHGFWVDLYVPATAPAGDYRGSYRLTSYDHGQVEIPVILRVWDFVLPPTPTLVTALGSPAQRMRGYYRDKAGAQTPADWQAVESQCAQLLSEHRINATPPAELIRPVPQDDGSFRIPSQEVKALREFVDRYHVNAIQVPHPSAVVKDPEAERDKLRAWLAAFDRASNELDRPGVVLFIYLKDEPNTEEDYRYVQEWGRAIRAAKSVVQVMVVEQTWTEPGKGGADSAWGDLYGAVDIWCPLFSLHRPDSAAKRRALGETIWTYTALCQGTPTPWWHIDYPLLNYRVPAWMAWRDSIKGLLYWGGMSYWRQTDDPWLQAPIYIGRGALQQGRKDILFNGEGSLVYPARAVGYDGVVPTIRLKALRDAIEDYEYLAILSRLDKSEGTMRVVRQLTDSWFQWDKDPAAYEKARTELASMIESTIGGGSQPPAEMSGPLRVHPTNPRYFTDDSGRAIYLTGSHTWTNLQDVNGYKDLTNLEELGGFQSHLEWLRSYDHNFIRLWILEHASDAGEGATIAPLPWPRTGPGQTLDGKPKFDLTRFDPAYLDRLRARVIAAGEMGFYVSIMLFDSWSVEHQGTWKGHPFHASNNINGINGDPDGDGLGVETHMLKIPAVTRLQEAYARKVVDTVNDLNNVLYEISNESEYGVDWHNHLARLIQSYEGGKPKQHPVGITGGGPTNEELFSGPADWISPTGWTDLPASDGSKVVIIDTDHIGHVDRTWIWRSFLRGHNPILMDWMHKRSPWYSPADQEAMRWAMGQTLKMARRMNLAEMTPQKDLASTTYCLADPGREYLIYQSRRGETFTVELKAGTFQYEWLSPTEGPTGRTGRIEVSDGPCQFQPPFKGDAVLYVERVQ